MAEIDYEKEKTWFIKEDRPIPCRKVRNKYEEWDIIIPPMLMTWGTFNHIISTIMPVDTYAITYDYENGESSLSVTEQGLLKLQSMTDLVNFSTEKEE